MKNERGQLLIEILVVIAVITLAMVATLAASTRASRVSRSSRNKQDATNYANTQIENMTRDKEQNAGNFFQAGYCPACSDFTSAAGTVFSCKVTCIDSPPVNPDTKEIVVTVSWSDSPAVSGNADTSKVELSTQYTKTIY